MSLYQVTVVPDRGKREDSEMSEKAYLLISAAIFALVAVLHVVRLVNHWSFQIGVVAVPLWGSWLGLVIGTRHLRKMVIPLAD